MNIKSDGIVARAVAVMVAAGVVAVGCASLIRGFGSYRNWYGQPVFGPVAIAIGALIIFGAFHAPTWKKLNRRHDPVRRERLHLSDHQLFLRSRTRRRSRFRWTEK